ALGAQQEGAEIRRVPGLPRARGADADRRGSDRMGRPAGRQSLRTDAEKIVRRPRPVLLDASFLIDLERDTASGEQGPARRFLPSLRGRPLVVSLVTVGELLDGAANEAAALASLPRFSIQGLDLAQARRC